MPQTISLAAYAIRVYNLDERENEPIHEFGEGCDLINVVRGYLRDLRGDGLHDEEGQHVLRVERLESRGRTLYGIIETGEYGVESNLWDVRERAMVHRRRRSEADMRPFYFLLDLPEGPDEGVLILQRAGLFGIRRVLYDALRTKFRTEFGDYDLKLQPVVDQGEIDRYVRGRIQTVRFISYEIPTDITDAFAGGHRERQGYAELVIHARRGGSLPINGRLREIFSGNREASAFIALDETNFPYDKVKITSQVGRSSRTVDLARLNRLRSYYDISDEVELDARTGHPAFDSIHGLAQDLAGRILDSWGV